MDNLIDDLAIGARRCELGAQAFETEPVKSQCEALHKAVTDLNKAWSGSFIGYHAFLYTSDLQPKRPGEHFDREWGGIHGIPEPWVEFDYDAIKNEILMRAGIDDFCLINEAVVTAQTAFNQSKEEILPTLEAVLAVNHDQAIQNLRDQIAGLISHVPNTVFMAAVMPRNVTTRDSYAIHQGLNLPPHLQIKVWLNERESFGSKTRELAKLARRAERYLQQRLKMQGNTVAKTNGKIFIGHGRSSTWRDLKDFVQDRLQLEWDEFNRESTAGIATATRLEAMLNDATFAFLIMTAEDEHSDTTKHARENVIHEVGLFQGRLGFARAIVLLEEGCAEFSNIHGLGQIRFPAGNILSKSEEIRRVLEREGIIK